MQSSRQIQNTLPVQSADGRLLNIAADKSISHRAVIFAALAPGESTIRNFLQAEDTLNTLKAFTALGLKYRLDDDNTLFIDSPGFLEMSRSSNFPGQNRLDMDMGNSGTAMRLLCGLFAGWPGSRVSLDGDDSLRKRPMARVADPLNSFGARVTTADNGRPPLDIQGSRIQPVNYKSPVASAQVKSCLLLSALMSGVPARIEEPSLSRNHTEKFLSQWADLTVEQTKNAAVISMENPPARINPFELTVPADISGAAFFIAAGMMAAEGSRLKLKGIGVNPTRSGLLDVLPALKLEDRQVQMGEETATLVVEPGFPADIKIGGDLVPRLIDEIPLLSVVGLFCPKGMTVRDAEELRHKESDRIELTARNLQQLGATVTVYEDGFDVDGTAFLKRLNEDPQSLAGIEIKTAMDHRMVMAFAVLDAMYGLNLNIEGRQWAATSFPDFFPLLNSLLQLNGEK